MILPVIRSDGVIIKPDGPAKPLDRCFLLQPWNRLTREGITVFAGNTVSGYRILYLLCINMHPTGKRVLHQFQLLEAEAERDRIYALYNPENRTLSVAASATLLQWSLAGKRHLYQIAAPVHHGVAFLGDVSKHVSASHTLIHTLSRSKDCWRVTGQGTGNAEPEWVFYCEHPLASASCNGMDLQVKRNGALLTLQLPGPVATGWATGTRQSYVLELKIKPKQATPHHGKSRASRA